MAHKNKASDSIDGAVNKSINFELTIADIAKRSERRAWWVGISAVGMSLILASGYFFMLPLKERVPYLVMADAYTGTSTVARLTEDSTQHVLTANEAINRSNVAHFVLARESYDVAMMNLHDWNTVLTMSSPGVAATYTSLYAANNPDNPFKTYGRDKAIRVKILSIVLLGGSATRAPKGATVRFQRSLYDKLTGATQPMDGKIATLEFTYKPNLKMPDQYRVENPLGFQVTSYRVDDDFATAPPNETQAPTPNRTADQSAVMTTDPATASSTQSNAVAPPPISEHEQSPPNRNATQGVSRP